MSACAKPWDCGIHVVLVILLVVRFPKLGLYICLVHIVTSLSPLSYSLLFIV